MSTSEQLLKQFDRAINDLEAAPSTDRGFSKESLLAEAGHGRRRVRERIESMPEHEFAALRVQPPSCRQDASSIAGREPCSRSGTRWADAFVREHSD